MGSSVNDLPRDMQNESHMVFRAGPGPINHIRHSSDGDPDRTVPDVVPSRDGSSWLPKPSQQTRTKGSTVSTTLYSRLFQPQFVSRHECHRSQCSMAAVFETTELLEMILSFLEADDIVELQRTCRMWESLIRESPQLRPNLFAFAQWNREASGYQLLNIKLPGLHFELGEHVNRGRWFHISMGVKAARTVMGSTSHLAGFGSYSRMAKASRVDPACEPSATGDLQHERLFVVQPPVVSVQAFIIEVEESESSARNEPPGASAKLACDAGITLGFLAETTLSLLDEGEKSSNLDESRSVVYKAIVSFCAPTVALRKRSLVRTVTVLG